MRYGIIVITTFLLLATGAPLFGQADREVLLILPPLPDGSDASAVFSDWGIKFSSESGDPVLSERKSGLSRDLDLRFPFEAPAAINQSPNLGDAGALIITFSAPVRRVSLEVGAESETVASITYFGLSGTSLGSEAIVLLPSYEIGHRRGEVFEDEKGRLIGEVRIRYDRPTEPETLFRIWADFQVPPTFRRCIAQIAHGVLPETERKLRTQLSLLNPAPANPAMGSYPWATARLELWDSTGQTSSLLLDRDLTPVSLGPSKPELYRTMDSVTGLQRGYACVTANYPIEFGAVYRLLDSADRPIAEAGIQAAIPGYRFFGLFQQDPADGAETALAVVNLSEEVATVRITFWADGRQEATWTLGPGEQRARFVDEIIPGFAEEAVEGTVEIVGDREIVGTLLRTLDGVVSASLPLGRSPAPGKR